MRTAAISVVMACCCCGCFAPAPAAQYVQQARRLHDGALASAVVTNPDLRDYIQLVGRRIVAGARAAEPDRTRDPLFSLVQFHLVACAVPNVFTTGGEHIYVCNGLFQLCRDEDELAAAIAHAYAHAVDLDVEHLDLHPDANVALPLVAWEFVTHRFTLAQERAADQLAFEFYTRAGYDPAKFAALFEHLSTLFPQPAAGDRVPLVVRARLARDWAAPAPRERRPLPVADPRTFVSLRAQAAPLNPELTPTQSQLFLRAFPNCVLSADTPDQQAAQQILRPVPPPTRLEPS